MQKVSLDFETYSEADIKKWGAWGYACHPSTEVICMAYAIGESAPVLWLPGEALPEFIREPGGFTLHAWNSFFEWGIWHHVQGWPETDMNQWHDTAALAAALALPRALGECGAALGISQDKQKDRRGKYLIQRLCKPNRGKRIQDTKLLQELYDYCLQDVIAEREIAAQLRPLNRTERQVWELDQKINIRGVHVDMGAVDHALIMIDQTTQKLNEEVAQITNRHLTNVSQRQRVMDYISHDLGYPLMKFDKVTLGEVLKDDALPDTARRLIEIRQQLGKTSTAKYSALKELVTNDQRAHGLLMYHGASTGRWSGRHFQPQNLPRPAFKNTDVCIELFQYQDAPLLDVIYNDAMEALSSCLRGMICAPKGKRLMVSDYSAIEARVLAWLAGQQDVLEVFQHHGLIYEHTASRLYGIPLEQVTEEARFIGKVATLALGYQGGARAFQGMAQVYGVEIDTDLADRIKNDWRKANRNIVQFWWNIEKAAIQATKNPNVCFHYRLIHFRTMNHYLFCRLPSGRLLAYYQPRIIEGDFKAEQLSFMGSNSVTRKWERQKTYGGKLVENITQAVARDLMAEAMLRVEAAGYEIVLSVHDELIAEASNGFGSVEEFQHLMCQLPDWAKGLPLKSQGFECQRYRK
ncbi:DNA polymerase [Candidatus Williamhamiltonella defendens]|uniref:DNA-directed DNA polymerase n=1 Tax=Candidatus Hamiltonella defensa (Bemisia tabaci) TaxID=672795 RepID=A0A249DYN2_9ENTR|nr:DNA polymerase [Candidatus Hamiltonella defensa]ASX25892.1 XRE family transcriptional regulator [Candidatus Hamiltonella defensa (Bemisia tabaci)]